VSRIVIGEKIAISLSDLGFLANKRRKLVRRPVIAN